ncbi:MAG TPA: tannase/feruloyl esterase family alpha/beta hydrolase [Syntrophorhabdales bacterium]|nr:tannase/feruloyl esterase family alpha/beta hydrolase [Syntrophorhabdales bacterium]
MLYNKRFLVFTAAVFGVVILTSCQYAVVPGDHQFKSDCAALSGMIIAKDKIALPTNGAISSSATLVPATSQTVDANGNVVPAVPEYCKVLGSIAPLDPKSPPINFEVNLPTKWNEKSMHYGGGGLNGILITGLAQPYPQPPNSPTPLDRGYATFGSDSGHQGGGNAAFGLNKESLLNFCYEQLKKTKDAAFHIIKTYYGKVPKHSYFDGNSEGGREAHTVTQRYPDDYDGVIALAPIINEEGTHIHDNAMLTAFAPAPIGGGGWMNANKIKLIADSTNARCDAQDGLADGIISKYGFLDPDLGWRAACQHDVSVLRCDGGLDTGNTCLSDTQIAAVHVIRDRFVLPFKLPSGSTGYVSYGAMGGEDKLNGWAGPILGTTIPPVPQPPGIMPSEGIGGVAYFGHTNMRFFVAQDPDFQTYNFDPVPYKSRIEYLSSIIDSIDPDISKFLHRGGKLIMKDNTADYHRSVFLGVNYYKSLLDRFGEPTVENSVRLYVAVGANHFGQNAPSQADLVTLLENWVEKGIAPPKNIDGVTMDPKTFNVTASRPMCGYGLYPKYSGSGDPNIASSFVCTPLMGK